VQDFTAAAPTGDVKKFKMDPPRLLYSLHWRHNATPPDFHLELVEERKPQIWFDYVPLTLLGELKRR
jgi:hypothetical protein